MKERFGRESLFSKQENTLREYSLAGTCLQTHTDWFRTILIFQCLLIAADALPI